MDEDAKTLLDISSGVCELRGELHEFRRETLRRLDTLETSERTSKRERSAVAAAFVSSAAGVISCISRFLPVRG
jgi:gamma-glutamylcyclotransferase (GGCT)/AIG2-like uncharacterized protein YtfP